MTPKTTCKLLIVSTLLIFMTIACKTDNPTIVGVWKPSKLILSDSLKKESIATLIEMTFEKSKEIYYKFNSDSTFGFISDKQIPGLEKAKGKYSIKGQILTMDYGNKLQESEIIKLTNTEMEGRSKDGITIIYEKLKDE